MTSQISLLRQIIQIRLHFHVQSNIVNSQYLSVNQLVDISSSRTAQHKEADKNTQTLKILRQAASTTNSRSINA